MKTKTPFTTGSSIRLLLLPLLLLFISAQLSAQPPRKGPPHRVLDQHRLDSIHHPKLDSTRVHRHDSIPPFAHRDSIRPKHRRVDSTFAPRRHDTIPPFHPKRDSIRPRPERHRPFPPRDTTHHEGDTTRHNPGGPDTSNHGPRPPKPPVPPRDTIHHDRDTTEHGPNGPGKPDRDTTDHGRPRPPFPHDGDTTDHSGGDDRDSTGKPRHKVWYITDNSSEQATITIYPNPVINTSTLRIENAKNEVTFRLYEMSGRLVVIQKGLGNGNYQLSKGDLSPGVYLYEMVDENTSTKTGSIIIQ